MSELTPEEKMENAVKAFLSLETYLIPQFIENLANNGIYINVNMSYYPNPVGAALQEKEPATNEE
jgi:hypothetical protein